MTPEKLTQKKILAKKILVKIQLSQCDMFRLTIFFGNIFFFQSKNSYCFGDWKNIQFFRMFFSSFQKFHSRNREKKSSTKVSAVEFFAILNRKLDDKKKSPWINFKAFFHYSWGFFPIKKTWTPFRKKPKLEFIWLFN